MRFLIWVLICVLMKATTVEAQELNDLTSVSSGDAVTEVVKQVTIPDVTGMPETEAVAVLEELVLPDENKVEIIKKYEYSTDVEKDIVFSQTPVGVVATEQASQVTISVSMGPEPNETLAAATTDVSKLNSFGIAAYIEPVSHPTSSALGIDWDSLPHSYEYNWDNSDSCWKWGVWVDDVCYKTPEGEYDTNVRHKMQLYCDGKNVYLHIVFARVYWDDVNGNDYRFYIDDQMTAFQLVYKDGNSITGQTDSLDAGTHQIQVIHRNPSMSGQVVDGSLAYLTKYEDDVNAEIELMIPLSEMEYQTPDIDLENMSKIEFFTYNLMYRRITASGASTFPMASAGIALIIIPGSTVLLKRFFGKEKREKKVKGANEYNV